ncbi:U3 small nucleolar RNA-associated protein 25 homolog [Ischnura elegans]|uniref:U3 small nucleolar RNA-associated protein 25 homolog n=1 Tax=Ischnura elegans TaxID=197161 RepID=UPI001ED8BB11|nr:U3 small nucleolar RNA-associated protein 25 homolog [Ischnura elegans]
MARGGKRQFGGRRGRGGKKRKIVISKEDAHHYKEFGEVHPSEEATTQSKRTTRVVDDEVEEDQESDSDSEVEEIDPYKKLLSSLAPSDANLGQNAIESDESEGSSEEEETNVDNESDLRSDVSADGLSVLPNDEGEPEAPEGSDTVNEDHVDVDEEDALSYPSNDEDNANNVSDTDNNQDSESEGEIEENESDSQVQDPFLRHLRSQLSEDMVDILSSSPLASVRHNLKWPKLGNVIVYLPKFPKPSNSSNNVLALPDERKVLVESISLPKLIQSSGKEWSSLFIKSQIRKNLGNANPSGAVDDLNELAVNFTALQNELFTLINSYKDLYFPECRQDMSEEVRFVYVLHAVNHVLKTRNEIVKHNSRLEKKSEVPDQFRDQGLVRPKVLILVPFREAALRIVKMIISILVPNKKDNVSSRKRFFQEYTGGEIAMPKKNPKPEDYEVTFSGNTDDNFKIGLAVTKKSLKLYSDFYSSDILIASPLGLRVLIGAEGEKDRDYDYLASLELLIMDGSDIFMMQNWDHVIHLSNHIHLQPSAASIARCGTDFSRVRPWAVEGHTRHYRQTLVFASTPLPGITALFASKCKNYEGAVRVMNPVLTGSISQVVVQMPQVFHRIDAKSAVEAIDLRFNTFTSKILPQYKDKITKHVMIYVPQYFDYVRIRNYLKSEDASFVQICEYSKDGRVAQARDLFFHGKSHFLLYSERFHFFRRVRVKGIKHIIFYQPPSYPHFYSELCNFMQASYQRKNQQDSNVSVAVLYSQQDVEQLAGIVGSDRAAKMITAIDRNVHMFVTGE